ncbi:MAG: 2-iminoacetate synthase ThiH [Candidatus Methanomethylophilus sp.]|nr:2-iminoacetate synthase ThiH [Methanomethylophilus sp.]MDD3232674.1 2-iminoacetate synthase ThiH [Methanomethylophilus sp.]MDD4669009.1 2-iminoacetate synthase ThiH [Methanomethylophilus sp.]
MGFREPMDVMDYLPEMEHTDPEVLDRIMTLQQTYNPSACTAADVRRALDRDYLTPEDFGALLSPAAEPFLEKIAVKAKHLTRKHFGNAVCMFTPIYTSNYCDNRCVYCGFNHDNLITRAKLTPDEVETEMANIASTGLTEILILTGESREYSDPDYVAMCVATAAKHFSSIGLEIYPLNSNEYQRMHDLGADYVTVFQETYDPVRYAELHRGGNKRIFSYRLNTQERALQGGMRGVAFGTLLGLRADWRKDAFACGVHGYLLQRKYPYAEISYSLPRLRPCSSHEIDDNAVSERNLLQVALAYRLFMPFAGETISTRERPTFRDGVVNICVTKISAGSSVRIGGHSHVKDQGDGQFDLSDHRGVEEVRDALRGLGLQPVFNDYVRTGMRP